MRADNCPCDRQAKSGATCFSRARLVKPEEWLKHLFQVIFRHAGAIVGNRDEGMISILAKCDAGRATIAPGIVDNVAQGATYRLRTQTDANSIVFRQRKA